MKANINKISTNQTVLSDSSFGRTNVMPCTASFNAAQKMDVTQQILILLQEVFFLHWQSVHIKTIMSRAKGVGSPVNRQSAGQRRDTVQKSLI